ncbi:hypothetical protein J2X65_000782 [Ancylobacter sp. 3268]|uniref:hypothetical protein n=1 Tax=Ancylobacter sp. 3268 TaxID=2817752 RepID=UPI002861296F|nr:hypothetical protein [Ancylobacter sp. 3268]MDR6951434.1 hypothetical protein [Ancylobacter sp. 3268]
MSLKAVAPFVVALLLGSAPAVLAGPCTQDIVSTQEALDRLIADLAANGPTAPESEDATLSHEPTPGGLAQTEAELGEGVAPEQAQAELDKARAADEREDSDACHQALAKARDAIGLE